MQIITYFHAISCPCCTHCVEVSRTFATLGTGTMGLTTYYATLQHMQTKALSLLATNNFRTICDKHFSVYT